MDDRECLQRSGNADLIMGHVRDLCDLAAEEARKTLCITDEGKQKAIRHTFDLLFDASVWTREALVATQQKERK